MSVLFDQLRVADNGKRLYISIHVNRASYFNNLYLDSLTIVAADKVSETSVHTPAEDYIYRIEFEEGQRQADLVLQPTDFNEQFAKTNFGQDLFFVFVKVKGVPDACTPCPLDSEYTLGVTFDENLLHQRVMDYTKQLAQDCTVPTGFTDFILLWNMFKASIETDHYIPAIKYYNMLFGLNGENSPFGTGSTFGITKGCGCHG